jgi:hypothetical protein
MSDSNSEVDATIAACLITGCPHCSPKVEVIDAGRDRHVVAFGHEPHCPEYVEE